MVSLVKSFLFFVFDLSYWQITNTVSTPEVAFTGDTMSDFIVDEANIDVLRARILVMEVGHMACCLTYPYYSKLMWF